MEIITKEMLAETLIKNILVELRQDWEDSKNHDDQDQNFDEYLFSNLYQLGEQVYTILGDHIGGEIE